MQVSGVAAHQKSSLSIMKKLRTFKKKRFQLLCSCQPKFLKEDFNGCICQMLVYCQGNAISITVKRAPITSHLLGERCYSSF